MNDTDNKPTGSLEDLFRHHLAEAEVPTRTMLWDQIDNSLLVRQNETYRRRLVATRWVAAASLFLATLAGTGWWAQHDATSNMASTTNTATRPTSAGTAVSGQGRTIMAPNRQLTTNGQAQQAADQLATSNSSASGQLSNTTGSSSTINNPSTSKAQVASTIGHADGRGMRGMSGTMDEHSSVAGIGHSRGLVSSTTGRAAGAALAGTRSGRYASGRNSFSAASSRFGADSKSNHNGAYTASRTIAFGKAESAAGARNNGFTSTPNATAARGTVSGLNPTAATALAATTQTAADAASLASTPAAASSFTAEALELMAARTVALNGAAALPLPTGLAVVPVTEMELPTPARKWQFGASYAVGVFNPNVNFSRAGIAPEYDYNPALGTNSPALSEVAAAEYRQNLKSGLTQRLALRATRRLTGHWTLNTGLEVGRHEAASSTSGYFVGEQVPDLGQGNSTASRKTSFRYHTAGIPIELRYANPVKRGWSAYGRMGAVVNALLGVRADVEGIPEASRTYSLLGASNPYRRVSTTVRGGMGAQFRPTAGNWSLNVGPTAEIGVLSLNAHPAQSFFDQSRAYSFGLEAGIAFGH